MKATLDIPDDLYRRVKARSALEGRPLRSVAIELLQSWLETADTKLAVPVKRPGDEAAPWLAITRRSLRPDMSHNLDSIREAIATGWRTEVLEK